MKAQKIVAMLLGLFVSLPISIYIRYSLLAAVHADRLLWFLFWVDIPVTFLLQVLFSVIESASKDDKA
jgi:hypothetical protein